MKLSMRFLLVAVLYGALGMLMGIIMGAKGDFTLAPVHAHLNLLGWVALTIYGLTYQVFPAMAASKLARVQFYSVNLGVILLIPSLALVLLENSAALPTLIIGELLVFISLLLFFANLWAHRNA